MDKTNCLNSLHCTGCKRKLAEVSFEEGIFKIKCRCGIVNTIEKKKNKTQSAKSIRS